MSAKLTIRIKDFFGTELYPMSRSQGRILCKQLEGFDEVLLDFLDISSIGQAFAHEVFVKFAKEHNIEIHAINQNENVNQMILRVKNTR